MGTVALAACSDGGGGAGVAPHPTPPPTSSPSPTSVPTGSPLPLANVAGKIVSFDDGSPLAGAGVFVSHTLVPGATMPTPPADGESAVTAADGSYAVRVAVASYPSNFYIEVLQSGRATAHERLTVNAPTTTAPTIGLTTLSADELAWLTLVNQDRATWGAPPVVFDETAEEVARLWVDWSALGHYEHACSGEPNCPDKAAYEAAENADFSAAGENIDVGPSAFAGAEFAFMAESANCPVPVDPATCPFEDNTGHFLNIVTPYVAWIGLAEDFNGTFESSTGPYSPIAYFDQEFADANISGASIYLGRQGAGSLRSR